MASVLLVLLMPNDDHHEDPQIYENEACHEEPHSFLRPSLPESDMAPEDHGVNSVIKYEGSSDQGEVPAGVHVEPLVEFDVLLEVSKLSTLFVTHFIVASRFILFYYLYSSHSHS